MTLHGAGVEDTRRVGGVTHRARLCAGHTVVLVGVTVGAECGRGDVAPGRGMTRHACRSAYVHVVRSEMAICAAAIERQIPVVGAGAGRTAI